MGYFLNRAKAFLQNEMTWGQQAPGDSVPGTDCELSERSELSPPPPVAQLLREALADKEKELALRHRDLESEYYKDDPWCQGQIAILKHHISEIERFLKEGGALDLPRCCRQAENICLGAVRGFNICILSPEGCGYALQR